MRHWTADRDSIRAALNWTEDEPEPLTPEQEEHLFKMGYIDPKYGTSQALLRQRAMDERLAAGRSGGIQSPVLHSVGQF